MPDALPAFEQLWARLDTERTKAQQAASAAVDLLAEGREVTEEQITAAAERARRRLRRSRLADAVRGIPAPIIPDCTHPSVTEVESAGEVVAGLCLACDAQLSAAWFTCLHKRAARVYVDPEALSWPSFMERLSLAIFDCPDCGTCWWKPVAIAEWARWL